MDPTKLRDEALRLPADVRARLAAELLGSLDDSSDDVSFEEHDAAWGAEIAERLRRIDAGEVKPVPWSEAREHICRKP